MRRDGFVALLDAVIFTMVVMLALTATIGMGFQEGSDDRDARALLEDLLSAEVRMSDLVEGGDGSSARVSDLCALMLTTDQPGVEAYVEAVLGSFSGDRQYRLELRFGDEVAAIGYGGGIPSVSAEAVVPVTTGGELGATLVLYAS